MLLNSKWDSYKNILLKINVCLDSDNIYYFPVLQLYLLYKY